MSDANDLGTVHRSACKRRHGATAAWKTLGRFRSWKLDFYRRGRHRDYPAVWLAPPRLRRALRGRDARNQRGEDAVTGFRFSVRGQRYRISDVWPWVPRLFLDRPISRIPIATEYTVLAPNSGGSFDFQGCIVQRLLLGSVVVDADLCRWLDREPNVW